jgi:hypothetical protein
MVKGNKAILGRILAGERFRIAGLLFAIIGQSALTISPIFAIKFFSAREGGTGETQQAKYTTE